MNRPRPVTELKPNPADISQHLYQLFSPDFVKHPEAWIEIAYALPDGKLGSAKNFSAFELKQAAEFAEAKNAAGYNVYVGASLRHGKQPRSGRANADDHFHAARFSWIEYDGADDAERVNRILVENKLKPAHHRHHRHRAASATARLFPERQADHRFHRVEGGQHRIARQIR